MITWSGGGIPFGYKWNETDNVLEMDKKENKVLQLIFNLAAKGKGVNIIAQELNYKGLISRRGKLWNNTTIGYILSKIRLEFYLGYIGKDKGNWIPLLDRTLYKEIMKYKKDITIKQPAKRKKYLLPGLGVFKCGYCGSTIKSSITKLKNKKVLLYYTCKNRITSGSSTCGHSILHRQDVIDPLVMTDIKTRQHQLQYIYSLHKEHLRKKIEQLKNESVKAKTIEDMKVYAQKILDATNEIEKPFPVKSGETDKAKIVNHLDKLNLFNDRMELHYKVPINRNLDYISTIRLDYGSKE